LLPLHLISESKSLGHSPPIKGSQMAQIGCSF
jgi:hypothetical protein